METGIILSQTDLKKLLAKLLKVDEKQIVQSKYSFMIMGINHQTIDDKYKKEPEETIEEPLEENIESEAN